MDINPLKIPTHLRTPTPLLILRVILTLSSVSVFLFLFFYPFAHLVLSLSPAQAQNQESESSQHQFGNQHHQQHQHQPKPKGVIMSSSSTSISSAKSASRPPRPNDWKPRSIHQGFIVKSIKYIEEVKGWAYQLEHKKTGARLLYLHNDDDNKVFSIGFKTLVNTNNGIPHVLEHSLLCGSRKFPSKEPFVELLKGSLQTFLNAMTFDDKTLYPVASRNDKDFMNLMDVYLDAVFFPKIHEDPLILKQEGWRYDIDPSSGQLSYNGVVYNEMKGVYSNPERILAMKVLSELYPESPYSYESGGLPSDIPKLTQEEFSQFHRTNYHPTNSYIYLYGNGNMDQHLSFLDQEYLASFQKRRPDPAIPKAKNLKAPKEIIDTYSVNTSDPTEGKTYLTLSYRVGAPDDAELNLGMSILNYILLETQASPLRRALLDAKIGPDVGGSWIDGIKQPYYTIQVNGSEETKKEKFISVVNETLSDLVKKGIDPGLIEAGISKKEFALREADFRGYPKGLVYNYRVLDSWLYGGSPLTLLEYEKPLKAIKNKVKSKKKYFEGLIAKYLSASNKNRLLVVLKPEPGLDDRRNQMLRQQLDALKAKMSPEEIRDIQRVAETLKVKQQTPDSEEILKKLPLLTLKDVNPQAEILPLEKRTVHHIPVLFHDVFTSKITYIKMYFEISQVKPEDLPYLSLLMDLLGKLPTKNFTEEELSKEIDRQLGGLGFSVTAVPMVESVNHMVPLATVGAKVLSSPDQIRSLHRLVQEILFNTQFHAFDRLREHIEEQKTSFENALSSQGEGIASLRAKASISQQSLFDEKTGGLSFFYFLRDLNSHFEAKKEELATRLEALTRVIFQPSRLTLSLTQSAEDYDQQKPLLEAFLKNWPHPSKGLSKNSGQDPNNPGPDHLKTTTPNWGPLYEGNEGLALPIKVNYVALAGDFKKAGSPYSGSMAVLRDILGKDLFWNQIRVQGGAYGAHPQIARTGSVVFSSYRDPNLRRTLEVYKSVPQYLEKFSPSEREMRKYILGTISQLDSPLTPSMKGDVSDQRFFMGVSQEDVQKTRNEVLATQARDLQRLAPVIQNVLDQNHIAVVGMKSELEKEGSLFQTVTNVLEEKKGGNSSGNNTPSQPPSAISPSPSR